MELKHSERYAKILDKRFCLSFPSLDFSVLFSVTKPFSRDDGLKKEIGHKNKHMACYENGAFFLNTRMEI